MNNAIQAPKVHYGLIQEELSDYPWKLFVACIMLNLTSIKQVRPIISSFFNAYKTHHDVKESDEDMIAMMLRPLGMHNRRAKILITMSRQYDTWDGDDPKKLKGVGKYASDSYMIFCKNDLSVIPSDRRLISYMEWRLSLHNV